MERYHAAIEAGIFTAADKLELLYGTIVDIMAKGTRHNYCVNLVAEFFRDRFGKDYIYWEEKPITLPNQNSEPEPDLVIVERKIYLNSNPRPEEVRLVAEVSDSSLQKHQTVKVILYAEAGLSEYWIINLPKRRVTVHLGPVAEEGIYNSVSNHNEGSQFTSPFAGEVIVADLLPPPEEVE